MMTGREIPVLSSDLDLLAQARKALSDRSPFDAEEALARVPTLPVACSLFLSRYSDARGSKQRKLQGGSSAGAAQEPAGPQNVWVDTEDYFRPVALSDIEFLSSKSEIAGFGDFCFSIPCSPTRFGAEGNAYWDVAVNVAAQEAANEPDEVQEMEIDRDASTGVMPLNEEEEPGCSSSSVTMGWLLGSKHKVLLSPERASKKRRLLEEDAGLQRLFSVGGRTGVELDSNMDYAVCDVCCLRGNSHNLNCLLKCGSCQLLVHPKCYGVQDVVEGKWLCSWCKRNEGKVVEKPCLLCPKGGGALKPVGGESGSGGKFSHLVCCQWIPEVYVENAETMEPIMNIDGIKDTRRRLLCSLCKIKHGVCIRCSYGSCRSSFHPICARDAKHRMEMWGRAGCDNVELRTFCLKHSSFIDRNELQPSPNMLSESANGENSECGDPHEGVNLKTAGARAMANGGDAHIQNLPKITKILKKLVDQGKVNICDVAMEIGVSSDSLIDAIKGDITSFSPEWKMGLSKWFWKTSSVAPSGQHSKNGDSGGSVSDNGTHANYAFCLEGIATEGVGSSAKSFDHDSNSERSHEMAGPREELAICSSLPQIPGSEGYSLFQPMVEPLSSSMLCNCESDEPENGDVDTLMTSVADETNFKSFQAVSTYGVHPFIRRRWLEKQTSLLAKGRSIIEQYADWREESRKVTSCSGSILCDNGQPPSTAGHALPGALTPGVGVQLAKAKTMGILDLSPKDEVEGEMLYLQDKLLDLAVTSKHHCEGLAYRVVKNLPRELDALRKQKWDAVILSQFLCQVKEAKRQGRKERRQKEAQAVLAAATAAAAASSRISFRKDAHDDMMAPRHEGLRKITASQGRAGPFTLSVSRSKDSKLSFLKASSESSALTPELNEYSQICDICKKGGTVLNRILVCCNCKVAVHLACYHSPKDHVGPWYCELCEDILLQPSGPKVPVSDNSERSCCLCGGTAGAFRKSSDGQWAHAFCAEWLLESTFRRAQPNPVEGMDTLVKERDICYICHSRVGACLKCSYGHCLSAFHPMCARNAGLYMNIKISGAKLQHKAYCEKHSLEQREKVEIQQGTEELRRIKQIRVELEKLRLLCERIIKREKVKKELVLCSHDVLASKRDHVAFSVLVSSFFPHPDASSESVTTSLKGHTEDNKSCNEAVQRSDDISVDSTISRKRRGGYSPYVHKDKKTEDSSASQRANSRKTMERPSSSGKKLLHRPASVASLLSSDDAQKWAKSRKHTETFQKELVMTSDEASMQNQRLPKGFAYVPIGCLSKEKLEPDG